MGDDKNKRIDFVDLTKGVCIILVVMAHIGGAFEKLDYHSMIASFRMPLYFFISGIFFKSYEGLFGFFIRKINKLIIPFLFSYLRAFFLKYIVWKIAPGVFQLPVSWTELLVVFHDHALIKFNPPIWFLLALFNCNILFYLVHSLRNRRLGLMFALTLLIGTAGFYMGKHQSPAFLRSRILDSPLQFLPLSPSFRQADSLMHPGSPGSDVLHRHIRGHAHQQLCRQHFPILGLSLCRHIYDHAFLQEIQEAARHLVYGALLGHNTGHTRTFTPF